MAEIISEFKSQKGRPPIYPWEEWADGQARRLRKGQDFEAELLSFRTMVHRQARLMGMRAHTHINAADSSISIQFYVEDE